MSFDFALEKPCTHEVKLESVSIAPDTTDTIRFPRPPSTSLVTLFMDGVQVPQSGLVSVPSLPFSRQEPYRIVSGKSDLLYVKVGASGAPRIVQLLTGNAVRAADLARDLALKVPDLSFAAQGGRVVVSSPSPSSAPVFSFPDPRWTDRTSSLPRTLRILGGLGQVGIVPGRVASGRQICPGWDLVQDPSTPISGIPQLVFREPIRNAEPVFHVGYFTDASNCRRCHGSRIEFDYNVLNGGYETVDGADLLSQEFDKFLFTRAASHFKWPWLGSRLIDRIGGKSITASSTASAMITVDISSSFKTYQSIKTQQDQQFPFQRVSDAEFPLSIGEIVVKNPPGDPTVAVVVVTVTTRSRDSVLLKRVVGVPNPFTLAAGGKSLSLRG